MKISQADKIKYNSEDVVSHHGVAAVIKDANGNILIQEHVKYGFWTIPVGKVKEGQNVIDGLKQEILEECNLYIEEAQELIVKDYFYERDGNSVKVVSHLFDIQKYHGEMKNLEPTKHKQQIFMPIKEIKQLPYLSDLTLLYLHQVGIDRSARI
jgi:ADP-ribose pyrophosphatase YjhB (NUDIX family)